MCHNVFLFFPMKARKAGTHVVWWTQVIFGHFLTPHVIQWTQKSRVVWWTNMKIFPIKNLMWNNGPTWSIISHEVAMVFRQIQGPLFHIRYQVHHNTSGFWDHQTTWDFKQENLSEFRSTKPHLVHKGPSNHISFCGTNVVSWTLWVHYFTGDFGCTWPHDILGPSFHSRFSLRNNFLVHYSTQGIFEWSIISHQFL